MIKVMSDIIGKDLPLATSASRSMTYGLTEVVRHADLAAARQIIAEFKMPQMGTEGWRTQWRNRWR